MEQVYKVVVNVKGTFWYNDKNELHRLDGPAIELENGNKSWYINGLCHRLDGPAVECSDGSKFWYFNGKIHRLDGPANEYANGSKFWYINGKLFSEKTFNNYIKNMNQNKNKKVNFTIQELKKMTLEQIIKLLTPDT